MKFTPDPSFIFQNGKNKFHTNTKKSMDYKVTEKYTTYNKGYEVTKPYDFSTQIAPYIRNFSYP